MQARQKSQSTPRNMRDDDPRAFPTFANGIDNKGFVADDLHDSDNDIIGLASLTSMNDSAMSPNINGIEEGKGGSIFYCSRGGERKFLLTPHPHIFFSNFSRSLTPPPHFF